MAESPRHQGDSANAVNDEKIRRAIATELLKPMTGGTTNNLAMWARAMRVRNFPKPLAKDGRGYYSREKDNALFVLLDPDWFTPKQRRDDDNWVRTLGKDQYDWLKKTLETSQATFKFVFIHQLVGGIERAGRGGVEAVPFYE